MNDIEAARLRQEVLGVLNDGTEPETQTPAQAREDDARVLHAMRRGSQGLDDAETRAAMVRQITAALKTL
jgi:hypothetical protein